MTAADRDPELVRSSVTASEGPVKILIVDDSEAMRAIVRRALSTLDRLAGATVVEAADGREALAIIRAEQPDLVLSDWQMPEMTGIELLRALDAAAIAVPFGFVTSEATAEMHELAAAHGARFLITKPVAAQDLDRAVAAALPDR